MTRVMIYIHAKLDKEFELELFHLGYHIEIITHYHVKCMFLLILECMIIYFVIKLESNENMIIHV
jgi:hypothetical protein